MSSKTEQFIPLRIAVLTVSDSRTVQNDTSGDALVKMLADDGHTLADRAICPDDRYQLRAQVSKWIADEEVQVVVTTGGTGLTGRDGTPEAMLPLFDKVIDGFGEMFRAISYDIIGTSTLNSRAVAGVANSTFVFCLPGSTGACRDGWGKLIGPQLDARTRPCNMVELIPRLGEH